MRVGTYTMYSDFTRNQQRSIELLNTTNRQISSGRKIDFGYQDIGASINVMRLDQEDTSLQQNASSADMARQFALNTDTTLNQFVDTLRLFKTKMVKASSQSNSQTDLMALAQELKGLKEHLIELGNSSINGQYLFSGSAFSVKPIDQQGKYHGNGENVKSLISSGVQLPFNIDGQSLFLGSDSDYQRVIGTNVAHKNITKLNSLPPEDRYIAPTDTIADLTGNNGDGSGTNFYVSGNLSDGTSFKQMLTLTNGAKVQDLMDKVKDLYRGLVDVQLNNNGQLEIKDLNKGSSKIQFHMVASDNSVPLTKATALTSVGSSQLTLASAAGIAVGDQINIEGVGKFSVTALAGTTVTLNAPVPSAVVIGTNIKKVVVPAPTDVSQLGSLGVGLTEFVKSGSAPRVLGDITGSVNYFDHSQFSFNMELRTKSQERTALGSDLISDILGNTPTGITLNGNAHAFGAMTTINDLVVEVQKALNAEPSLSPNTFSANLINGKIVVYDKSIPTNQLQTASSTLTTMTLNAPANTFSASNGIEADRSKFVKDGAKLSANVPQIVNSTNDYVKPSDKLVSAAAASSLDGRTITMDITTIAGASQTVSINLSNAGSTFSVGGNSYSILSASSPRVAMPADQVTYQQLLDVVSMSVANILPATFPVAPATATAQQASDYDNAIRSSQNIASTTLDERGRIVMLDRTTSVTKATMAMYDNSASSGYGTSLTLATNSITFNSNNALAHDDPKIDFYAQLQQMIDAVSTGKTRANENGADPRNPGMQNGILALDHIFDHVVRKHTDIGAVGNSFQLNKDRIDTLSINVKTVRSQILDTDIGQASLELNQRMLNYQALLSMATKINQLSLVNYVK